MRSLGNQWPISAAEWGVIYGNNDGTKVGEERVVAMFKAALEKSELSIRIETELLGRFFERRPEVDP